MKSIQFRDQHSKDWLSIFCWIFLFVCWLSLFSRVSLWWNEASYYTHGYSVPLLALFLCFRLRATNATNVSNQRLEFVGFISFVSLYFISRIIAEPDPFWRLPLWIESITLSGCSVFLIRNSKIPISSLSLALVVLYFFTCLPWPAKLETWVVLSLSNLIGSMTGELLLLLGYPAEVSGSLIIVDKEEISINNACSGIRSLQNLISFSIFFSIYFRHSFLCFSLNLIFACVLTLIFNSMRALTLSLAALELGHEILQEWHDWIGNMFVCSSFLCLFFVSWFMGEEQLPVEGKHPRKGKRWKIQLPQTFSKVFIICIIFIEATSYLWFSYHLGKSKEFTWQIKKTKIAQPLSKEVREVLQFDYGYQQKVKLSDDDYAEVIFFGYHETSAAASLCSRNHPPDYCMAHTGVSLIESSNPITFTVEQDKLCFRHYISEENSINHASTHVFWCSSTVDSRIGKFQFENPSLLEKLLRFLGGKLSYKRQVVLVSMKGKYSRKQAKSELFYVLNKVISQNI